MLTLAPGKQETFPVCQVGRWVSQSPTEGSVLLLIYTTSSLWWVWPVEHEILAHLSLPGKSVCPFYLLPFIFREGESGCLAAMWHKLPGCLMLQVTVLLLFKPYLWSSNFVSMPRSQPLSLQCHYLHRIDSLLTLSTTAQPAAFFLQLPHLSSLWSVRPRIPQEMTSSW